MKRMSLMKIIAICLLLTVSTNASSVGSSNPVLAGTIGNTVWNTLVLEQHIDRQKLPDDSPDFRYDRELQSASIVTPFRINVGNTSSTGVFTDPQTSERWVQDQYFAPGSGNGVNNCATSSTLNTTIPRYIMYCNHRIAASTTNASITYNIPVQSGFQYTVRLHFLEPFFTSRGRRVTNIFIEGQIVQSSLDIFDMFGNSKPGSITYSPIIMSDSVLNIQLVPVVNRPVISGIEVLSVTGQAPTRAPTRTPTKSPTIIPTKGPTRAPTQLPTSAPATTKPTSYPTNKPLYSITRSPVTVAPITNAPFTSTPIASVPITTSPINSAPISTSPITGAPISTSPITGTPISTSPITGAPIPTSPITGAPIPTSPISSVPISTSPITSVPISTSPITGAPITTSSITSTPITTSPIIGAPISTSSTTSAPLTQSSMTGAPMFIASITSAPITTAPITATPLTTAPQTLAPAFPTFAPTAPIVFATLPLKMNIGYQANFTDSFGKTWTPEQYLVDPIGMTTIVSAASNQPIRNTFDDLIYRNVRQGPNFGYQIPLPIGRYEIVLHMCELFYNRSTERIFNVQVENEAVEMIDMLANNASKFTKYTLEFVKVVDDGKLDILFTSPQNLSVGNGLPVVAGITVNLVGPHLAHAVSNGPYTAIDRLDTGFVMVPVDASNTHTHGEDMNITSVVWTENNVVLGTNLTMAFNMSVGEHEVTLTVADSGGSTSTDQTTIMVHDFGFPSVTTVSPDIGFLGGGEYITLTGSGFIYPVNVTSVRFGDIVLEGSSGGVFIVNRTTIRVVAPPSLTSKDVFVSVITPRGESTEIVRYKYDIPKLPVQFNSGLLQTAVLSKPTACAFGPDKKLYVGNSNGRLLRYNVDFTSPTPKSTQEISLTVLTTGYVILSIAFDPAETNILEPMIYFSNCDFFHGEKNSSSGLSINGRISRMKVTRTSATAFSFRDLVHIITGLPVSDHDHGFNAIVFGNQGELYMANGGNTNGGRPGSMSSTGLQKDNYLSASVVVANVSHPNFNGTIRYTAPDDGDMVDRTHIDVFAHGIRNPYGLTLHSNGKLYATDNGPNAPYGSMVIGCGPNDFVPGQTQPDKVLLVEKDKYYGFPNLKRAAALQQPYQCVYHAPGARPPASRNYTPPIAIMPSSLGSIFEYTADYFDGQLRGNLIVAKYGDELWKVVLTPDGTDVVAASKGGISLGLGDNNLAAIQAPDGTIIEVRYVTGQLAYHKPVEPSTSALKVYSVFPVRGMSVGMYFVSIYGLNFANTTITVGGLPCLNQTLVSSVQIDCRLPGGTPGLVDIVASKPSSGELIVLSQAFRYITGFQM